MPASSHRRIKPVVLSGVLPALEGLLAEAPGRLVALAESRDFWDEDWTYEEVEALEAAMAVQFLRVEEHLTGVWGPPSFAGKLGSRGFPVWCPGMRLAYWHRRERIAAVWWEHQDKEAPILLLASAPAAKPKARGDARATGGKPRVPRTPTRSR
jgi:hypothetical protein